ncbi:hypothetical protein VTL71DRAFT_13185 [Oculimacula yallundae]|uniref:Uncharacterized protein n=1 Tax=Oculimacula yallundae TaxID=86028 RepID=A0ABR4CLX8_9HELO
MQLTNLLTFALFAVTATALPAPEPNAALEGRTLDFFKCKKDGGKYNWLKHKCEYPEEEHPSCDYGKKWNGHECTYPDWDAPNCDKYEHGWCSKSKTQFVTFTKGHDWCKKDGKNKVWCSDDKDAKDKCAKQY